MRRFRSIPEKQVSLFIQNFTEAIQKRLAAGVFVSAIPSRKLDRSALFDRQADAENWDGLPTIFSLLLYRYDANEARIPLTHNETVKIYQWLQLKPSNTKGQESIDKIAQMTRCQLGQPVLCGKHNGKPFSALRLCLSARLIVEACINNGIYAEKVIQRALSIINTIEGLATRL
jgi:hypothetical protein